MAMPLLTMAESATNGQSNDGAQGNEEQDDDYMADLSLFLPSEALHPPKSSSQKVTLFISRLAISFFCFRDQEIHDLAIRSANLSLGLSFDEKHSA